jgi:membrane glycosyltransferase
MIETVERSTSRTPPDAGDAWLPERAPMAMPTQDLWRRRAVGHSAAWGESDIWQVGVLIVSASLTICGGVATYNVMQVDGLSPIEAANLVLFVILFGWIAYALVNAMVGFGVSMSHKAEAPIDILAPPEGRTAILMPVHNEDPEAVFGRLGAMNRSLVDLAVEHAFHFFVLSDSRDPDVRRGEVQAFDQLRKSNAGEERLFYRRRTENEGRKAGNIAEWVRRFGGAYDYMVVLDADSLMGGETLARLALMMDREPRTGLIQTAPSLVNRISAFGRLQQFATRLYGPMLSDGLAHTSGVASNYWGHNAIIRTAAFAACAGLPTLPGPKPFGGEIMSHDFVEAALLRRDGWDIHMAPHLGGSYEECPPTLPDMILRERRWCQGNLQHTAVITARGLHWMSRVHMIQGVLSYLMQPVWLLFLLVGAGVSVEARLFGNAWDDYSLDTLNWIVAISVLSLLAPRGLALIRALGRSAERRAWGDPWRLAASVLLETALSALIAPIMMIAQTRSLIEILMGRDSGWVVQQREDGSLSWDDAKRDYLSHTILGGALGAGAWIISPAVFLWLSPVILGLALAIPLTVLTADPRLGERLRALGLFVTPEELNPPAILKSLANTQTQVKAAPNLDSRIRLALLRLLAVEAEA